MFPLTGLDVQQFVFGVVYEKSTMGPSALGYREDAKDGSHSNLALRTQNLDAPQLRKFLNCVKIVLFQPLW